MAGWRVSIEEKGDGHTLVWYNDAPGSSSLILRTFDSWDEAIDDLEGVRAQYVEEYAPLAVEAETPEKLDPDVETPEKKSAALKAAKPKKV